MNVPLGSTLTLDLSILPEEGTTETNVNPDVSVRVFEGDSDTPLTGTIPTLMSDRSGVPGGLRVSIPVTLDNGFEAGLWYNAHATWQTGGGAELLRQFGRVLGTFRAVVA